MTTYMGTGLGSMVPVRCLSNLRVQPEGFASVNDGMSGRRIYVDRPDRPALRTWQASINVSDPNAVGTLVELESLRVPLRMVSDEARVGNIFTPGAAVGPHGWIGVQPAAGPGVALEGGGFAATSVYPISESHTVYSPLFPVVPGIPVTVGVHVRTPVGVEALVRLDWMDLGEPQNGNVKEVAALAPGVTATAAPLPRVILSATPPSNVHVARLRIIAPAQIARPSATWTAQAMPWRPGMGAEKVHLAPLSYDVFSAREDQSMAAYNYTVTEVS